MSKPETLLVFGDSLSDQGNAFDLSGRVLKVPIPPASAGYNGWFSNGLIQSGVTADLLGVEAENYAVGGARAVGSRTVEQYLEENDFDTPEIMLADPDPVALATDTYLGGQLERYLLDALANPPADGTAAAIWIGANDYNALPLDASQELVQETIAAVVGNTILAAGAIAATGVERIFLYNLPAPEFLPLPLPPEFGAVVDGHNAALAQGAAFLASQGVDAEIVDMHRIGGGDHRRPAHLRAEPGLPRPADAARHREPADLGAGGAGLVHRGQPGGGGGRREPDRLHRLPAPELGGARRPRGFRRGQHDGQPRLPRAGGRRAPDRAG